MNPLIALQFQTPDIPGAMAQGQQYRTQMEDAQRQNALAAFMRQNGKGLMSGDTNALAGYAAYDPQGAMALKSSQAGIDNDAARLDLTRRSTEAGMANDAQRLKIIQAEAARNAAEHSERMDAFEREKTVALLTQSLGAMESAATPEEWDQRASMLGEDGKQLLGQFGNREQFLAMGRGMLTGLNGGMPGFKDLPSSVQEYTYAQSQGETRPYSQWLLETKKAGAQNITFGGDPKYGTIPQGFSVVDDPANPSGYRMEPIPGGPAAAEADAAAAAAEAAGGNRDTSTDIITGAASSIRSIIDDGGLPETGMVGQALSNLPSTQAAELRRQVEVLKANATFKNLTAMRQASPTGGALGAVSDMEVKLLEAATGALDPNASAADFARALDNYEKTLLKTIHGPEVGERIFIETRPGKTQAEQIPAPQGIDPSIWGVMTPEERALWQN